MIVSFRHKGLRRFWTTGNAAGIPPQMARRIEIRLAFLDKARAPADMNLSGFDFHELKGDRKGTFSVHMNGPYTITFGWDEGAILVDFENYH
jgi:proteic killer suppression protein